MQNLRLLIIEDDADQVQLMRDTLEGHFQDAAITWAQNRQEAMTRHFADFDLVLCDYNLPDASGMEILEHIVSECSTPVLMVTGENVGQIAAEAIQRGATDYVVKTGDYLFTIPLVVEKVLTIARVKQENERLRRELENTLAQLSERNAQLQQSLQKVQEMAATDPLTGLYNRRHFGKLIEHLFAEAQRYTTDLSCVMIDLDNYKRLNDSYGHQMGDQLLVLAAKVMSANLRAMDAAARYGGDEFVLLLPRAGEAEAQTVAQRIRDEYRAASARLLNCDQGVTMSVGISSLNTTRPPHADALVASADAALYCAKDAGRNQISSAPPAH